MCILRCTLCRALLILFNEIFGISEIYFLDLGVLETNTSGTCSAMLNDKNYLRTSSVMEFWHEQMRICITLTLHNLCNIYIFKRYYIRIESLARYSNRGILFGTPVFTRGLPLRTVPIDNPRPTSSHDQLYIFNCALIVL